MNEKLIQNWNSVVSENDIVYHLGDFSFSDPSKFLKRLNGKITVLYGSHDKNKSWPRMVDVYPDGLVDEYGNKRLIVLCHYSMRSWPKSHYASYHLFGHHHGRLEPYGMSMDCGIDTHNYFPYSLDEIIQCMSKLSPIVDYRKGKE